jgi:quercetin dioxygenase-like cupin family protein
MTNVATFKANHDTLYYMHTKDQKWLPWCIPLTQFKLLNVDPDTGRYALLIKVEKGCVAPVHKHHGAVEIFILEGEFHYPEDKKYTFPAGTYVREQDGAKHQPMSDEGALFYAQFHGALEGFDEKGNSAGAVDWKWHAEQWAASGQPVPKSPGSKK